MAIFHDNPGEPVHKDSPIWGKVPCKVTGRVNCYFWGDTNSIMTQSSTRLG